LTGALIGAGAIAVTAIIVDSLDDTRDNYKEQTGMKMKECGKIDPDDFVRDARIRVMVIDHG
jgi:hypothetical protein